MVANCGYGRKACASVPPNGKPWYGTWNPRCCGSPEANVDVSSERSAALFTFKPNDAIRCRLRAFRLFSSIFDASPAISHTPRLPTYAASTNRFGVTSRCSEMFQVLMRGGRPPFRSNQGEGKFDMAPATGTMPGASEAAFTDARLY